MNRYQVVIRLLALVAVAAVGLWFIAFDVLGDHLGTSPFPVTVQMARGGGLFAESYVTYRGVDVGRVASLNVTPSGVVANLQVDAGVRIPSNVTAEVHELSVAGEQYLDLVPNSSRGPYLKAGSVIVQSRTRVPVAISTLLNDATRLIASVHTRDVQTISTALGTGLAGTGEDLREITVAAQNLVAALAAAQSATVTIVNGGGTLLATVRSSAAQLAQLGRSIEAITAQLSSSNADVGALLSNGVPFEMHMSQFLAEDGRSIAALVQNLATLANVAAARQPAVEALLEQLPLFVHKIASVTSGGSIQVQLFYNNADTVCPYILGAQVSQPTASSGSPVLTHTCKLTAPDLLQRGSANAPIPGGSS